VSRVPREGMDGGSETRVRQSCGTASAAGRSGTHDEAHECASVHHVSRRDERWMRRLRDIEDGREWVAFPAASTETRADKHKHQSEGSNEKRMVRSER
jgi:hypothetical protein